MMRYPIYIISKGRAESRLTVKALEGMGIINYRVVVEPTEKEEYAKHIPHHNIYVLPFHDLGQGSIPARNWVWEHSQKAGDKRHWIMDDNIAAFLRMNRNEKIRIRKGDAIFRAMEDFVDRYSNVALAGPNYRFFCKAMQELPAFYLNTRVYSCILIHNSLDMRWRGRYNEDTDLSIRALKAGFCTVQFNAFLQEKQGTMTMKGGNTDTIYTEGAESRRKMTESLMAQHPDCVTMTERFGHPHHLVNYKPFQKNRLRYMSGIYPQGVNDYGMKLIHE